MRIFQLALRNLKMYKKHYLLVFIITLGLTGGLLGSVMIRDSEKETKKQYEISYYGRWYASMSTTEYNSIKDNEYYQNFVETSPIEPMTAALYSQGEDGEYKIGHLDQSKYELFAINVNGKDIQNKNDILVSNAYAKKNNVKAGDKISLTLLLSPGKETNITATITGTYDNHNEEIFPDILTSYASGYESEIYTSNTIGVYDSAYDTYSIGDDIGTIELTYDSFNEHGHDENQFATEAKNSYSLYVYFLEAIALVSIVIIVLSSTSLQKRAKELTLLRGIGMTGGQLTLMGIYENLVILFFSVLLGTGVAYGVMHIYGMLKAKAYGGSYLYQFDTRTVVVFAFALMIIVLLASIIPLKSAASNALTGAFDHSSIEMFKARPKKYKRQTLRLLAGRDISSNRRLNIAFLVFISIFAIYGSIYAYTGNDELTQKTYEEKQNDPWHHNSHSDSPYYCYSDVYIQNEDLDDYKDKANGYKQCAPDPSLSYIYQFYDIYNIKASVNDQKIVTAKYTPTYILQYDQEVKTSLEDKTKLYEGNLPENDHEILAGISASYYSKYYDLKDYPNLTEESSQIIDGESYNTKACYDVEDNFTGVYIVNNYEAGDKITLENNGKKETYTISGIISFSYTSTYNSYILLPGDAINCTSGDEKYVSVITYLETVDDLALYEDTLAKQYGLEEDYAYDVVSLQYNGMHMSASNSLSDTFEDMKVDPALLIVPLAFGLLLCYFLNQNAMINKTREYALLHLVGMTKLDLLKHQFWVSVNMSCKEYMILAFYFIMLTYTYNGYFPILRVLLIALLVLVFFMFVYMTPMIYILLTGGVDNLDNDD